MARATSAPRFHGHAGHGIFTTVDDAMNAAQRAFEDLRDVGLEDRKRMVCWADPRDAGTRAYLRRYWDFQAAFRAASDAMRGGDVNAEFPVGAFRPTSYVRATAPPS